MRHSRVVRISIAAAAAIAALLVAGVASAATITKNIPSAGTFAVPNAPAPQAGVSGGLPEVDPASLDADPLAQGATVNRGNSGGRFDHHGRHGDHHQNANPKLLQSFEGLNFFDQRFANGGNQFSVEPPDQGLCVGNGKVAEIVNDVYQVFDTHGHALTNPIDLNTLFGYAPAIIRSGPNAGQQGPEVFDPSCLYDSQTRTFFVVASVLDRVGTTGTLSGTSHVDIGVAKDPTSSYTFYRIDTTNDSPLCTLDGVNPGPCFPDYPHIGADRNGFYVTTNVFDFFGPNFDGVNIYALPKFKLASGASSVPVTIVSTNGQGPSGPDGGTGFSLIPAVTPDDQFDGAGGGTEYFVSSRAVFTNDGTRLDRLVEPVEHEVAALVDAGSPPDVLARQHRRVRRPGAADAEARQRAARHLHRQHRADAAALRPALLEPARDRLRRSGDEDRERPRRERLPHRRRLVREREALGGARQRRDRLERESGRRRGVVRDEPARDDDRPDQPGHARQGRIEPDVSVDRGHLERRRRHGVHDRRAERLSERRVRGTRREERRR